MKAFGHGEKRFTVLDINLPYPVIAVDHRSFEIISFTDKAKDELNLSDDLLGQTCYSLLTGKTSVCEKCPFHIVDGPEKIKKIIEDISLNERNDRLPCGALARCSTSTGGGRHYFVIELESRRSDQAIPLVD